MDGDDEFGVLPTDHEEASQLSDEDLYGPDAPPGVLPLPEPPRTADRIPSKYRKSAGASLLAAGMLGLRDIIEPPKDDKPVVEQHADQAQLVVELAPQLAGRVPPAPELLHRFARDPL